MFILIYICFWKSFPSTENVLLCYYVLKHPGCEKNVNDVQVKNASLRPGEAVIVTRCMAILLISTRFKLCLSTVRMITVNFLYCEDY